MNMVAHSVQPLARSLVARRPLVSRLPAAALEVCRGSGSVAGVPEGLAAIPNVRPTSGQEAHAWIKKAIAEYNMPVQEEGRYRSPSAASLRQMDDRFSFL